MATVSDALLLLLLTEKVSEELGRNIYAPDAYITMVTRNWLI